MASQGSGAKFLTKVGDLLSFGGGSTCVGLSIGTSSIKLVELKKSGKSWRLLHVGIVQLPEDTIVNREIVNPVPIIEGIKSLVTQIRLKNKEVSASLSGTSMIIRRLMLEVPNPKELQDQVFWEAEQYLPFEASDVVMDFEVLQKLKDNKMDILLVAVKRTTLDSYIGVIEDAGLKTKVVDTDYFALQDIYEQNYPGKQSEATAIVDIGSHSMKIVVVQGAIPVFTKDAAIGGRNLTQEIQNQLNLSFPDAEAIKVSAASGEAVPQEVSELMHIMCENIGTEIKRALDLYSASSSGAPVTSVLLTGGCSKIPNITAVAEEVVKLPVQLLNPFNGVTYDASVFTPDYLANVGPMIALPIGLALRAGGGAK